MSTIDHSLSGLTADDDHGPQVREVVARTGAGATELAWAVWPDDLRLAVSGDVCTATVEPLVTRMCELVAQYPVRLAVLDLADVSFADARAVRLLQEVDRWCTAAGSMLMVGRTSPAVDRLLHLCGFDLVNGVATP